MLVHTPTNILLHYGCMNNQIEIRMMHAVNVYQPRFVEMILNLKPNDTANVVLQWKVYSEML